MTTIRRFDIPDGDLGTDATVREMARLIAAGTALPLVRETAAQIVGPYSPKDGVSQALAIREWCKNRWRFLRDPTNAELLHDPEWILGQIARQGYVQADCDDAAILTGALAGSIGFAVALVTVAFLDKRAAMSHIWTSVHLPVQGLGSDQVPIWTELDITREAQDIPMRYISRSDVTMVMA